MCYPDHAFSPKVELVTTGPEPGVGHGDLLLIRQSAVDFSVIVGRVPRLRALPGHGIQILPAQQFLPSLD